MIVRVAHAAGDFIIDMNAAIDLSIPLQDGKNNLLAWGIDPPRIFPYEAGDFVGAIGQGSAVNFNLLHYSPHAHGTHTESIGHIREEADSVNELFPLPFLTATLISVTPQDRDGDLVILREQFPEVWEKGAPEALLIRTLPNPTSKTQVHYSGNNPAYLEESAAQFFATSGIQHLLIDLPSVDKEEDGGALLAHKAFWQLETKPREAATITELIYVPDTVKDGEYLLQIQAGAVANDAVLSRPLLYNILEA